MLRVVSFFRENLKKSIPEEKPALLASPSEVGHLLCRYRYCLYCCCCCFHDTFCVHDPCCCFLLLSLLLTLGVLVYPIQPHPWRLGVISIYFYRALEVWAVSLFSFLPYPWRLGVIFVFVLTAPLKIGRYLCVCFYRTLEGWALSLFYFSLELVAPRFFSLEMVSPRLFCSLSLELVAPRFCVPRGFVPQGNLGRRR